MRWLHRLDCKRFHAAGAKPQSGHEDPPCKRAASEYRYEKLTWPEINDAIDRAKSASCRAAPSSSMGRICHLTWISSAPAAIAKGAGQAMADKILVLPIVAYGYTGHVMDFPGTIKTLRALHSSRARQSPSSLSRLQEDHPPQRHGSNWPNLDLVARRTNLETDGVRADLLVAAVECR